jgi:hypothetical protein
MILNNLFNNYIKLYNNATCIYILTNGFLEYGYNYIYMFKNKNDTINFSKSNNIDLKRDLLEMDIIDGIENISIMITQYNNTRIIKYITNVEKSYSFVIDYYKTEQNKKETVKIKSNIMFKNNHTVLQFFGNTSQNSFSIITNIGFHNLKNII